MSKLLNPWKTFTEITPNFGDLILVKGNDVGYPKVVGVGKNIYSGGHSTLYFYNPSHPEVDLEINPEMWYPIPGEEK